MTDKRKIGETQFTHAARAYIDARRQAGAANWRQKVDAAAAKLHELSQDLVNRLPELLEHEGEGEAAKTWKRLAAIYPDLMAGAISGYAVHAVLPRPRHNFLEIAARIRRAGSIIAAAANDASVIIHLYDKGGPLARERVAIDQNLAADGHECATGALTALDAWASRLETAHRQLGPATGRTHIERHLGRPIERLAMALAAIWPWRHSATWPNDLPLPAAYHVRTICAVINGQVTGTARAPRDVVRLVLSAKDRPEK
jgi:hypothetical protein